MRPGIRTGDAAHSRRGIALSCCLLLAIAIIAAGCAQPGGTAPATLPDSGVTMGSQGVPTTTLAAGSCPAPVSGVPAESPDYSRQFLATELLTRPTNNSVTVSIVPGNDLTLFTVYGISAESLTCRTPDIHGAAGRPASWTIAGLLPDTQYYYRVCSTGAGNSTAACGPMHTFHTERLPGSTFVFAVQADSHPERLKTMFDPALYNRTLQNIHDAGPDFLISLGDDFSIDPLIEKNQLNQANVNAVYLAHREFLGTAASSSPIFLVNGNHEEAARYLLDGTPDNAAVYAGTARMAYFPQPVPDGFYTGDTESVPYVGKLGDYYSWQWGDALFVVIDPYWHSPVPVDNIAGSRSAHGKKDAWQSTLGDVQYQWLRDTLEGSTAKYKFVFAHHVLGTGRGGIEEAGLYEWGGRNQKGADEFSRMRPGWEMPVGDLLAKTNVTIFFQGHDHLFARQERDGVTYQEVPIPADPMSGMFNAEAYTSGIKLPNPGYLRVAVSPANTTVDYIATRLPGSGGAGENGGIAYSYSLPGGDRA